MPPQSSSTLPGYVAIRDILDGKFANKSLVNVYGLVSGFREAMQTKGKGENLSLPTVNYVIQRIQTTNVRFGSSTHLWMMMA